MKVLVLSLLSLSVLLTACAPEGEYRLSQGEIFHTSYHIKYQADSSYSEAIYATLLAFDGSLNPFDSTSLISKVNTNQTTEVDAYFATVLRKAQEVSEQSDGAFDITCAPLVNAWGFGFTQYDTITPEYIDSLRQYVGYQKITLSGATVSKTDPRVLLNASAIAKGYACDVVAELLEQKGCSHYMVEIGGEVRAKGKNPHGECWRIEIPKPLDDTTGILSQREEVIELCNKSMATSGNYRNYYLKEGKKYAHTIDPRTGYPAESDMLSATVLAKDCITADAYATTCMVLGTQQAMQLVDKLKREGIEDLQCFFIFLDEEGMYKTAYYPPR